MLRGDMRPEDRQRLALRPCPAPRELDGDDISVDTLRSIDAVHGTSASRFDQRACFERHMEARLFGHDALLAQLVRKVETLERRGGRTDEQLQALEARYASLEAESPRIATIEQRVATIERELRAGRGHIELDLLEGAAE